MSPSDPRWAVLVFVVTYLAMCVAISFLGGWRELAKRFRSDKSIEGERFRFRSVAMGWSAFPVTYGGCLFATVGPKGFRLSVSFPFFLLHPPLVIPWAEVERCEPVRYWFRQHAAVYVKGFSRRLLFRGSLGDKVLSTWKQARTPA